ncbi:hypothetical protein, partial [Xanthomonas sacchari]|uniref:hypothetical protein n=1 Tax=Xanthomonas sacchari TaxID=56458 RepID=UPI003526D774
QGALDQPSAVVKRFFWLPFLCASKEALLSSRRLIKVTRPQGRKLLLLLDVCVSGEKICM